MLFAGLLAHGQRLAAIVVLAAGRLDGEVQSFGSLAIGVALLGVHLGISLVGVS